MDKMLEGIVVLDLTQNTDGPYSTMMLADMGAEVIKIEPPLIGDESRAYIPSVKGESGVFLNFNRNKKGITLDIGVPVGRKIFLDLLKHADIVYENFPTGTMERYGLGYEQLKTVKPEIVYLALSCHGRTGPHAHREGCDGIAQAESGCMSISGWPDSDPLRGTAPVGDAFCAMVAAVAALAALNQSRITGQGQMIDIAQRDCLISSVEHIGQIYLHSGRVPGRIGNRYENIYPYDSFRARDGMIVIGAGNDKLFNLLVGVMRQEHLLKDDRFRTNADRKDNWVELKAIIEEWLKDYDAEDIVKRIMDAGCPAAEVFTLEKVSKDKHFLGAREMFVTVEDPSVGAVRLVGNAIKASVTKIDEFRPAPSLGRDNGDILKRYVGLSDESITQLRADGVI